MSADFREIGAALSSDLASQYQHYWTVNLGHRGVVRQGEFVCVRVFGDLAVFILLGLQLESRRFALPSRIGLPLKLVVVFKLGFGLCRGVSPALTKYVFTFLD